MPTFDESFPAIETALFQQYGRLAPQARDNLFPAMVAALLSRSLDSATISKALDSLADAGFLESNALAEADTREVVQALKAMRVSIPARGVATLQRLARWYLDELGDRADTPQDVTSSTEQLRESLASVNGIGLASADALLLFAFERAVYPVDRASYRVLARHGWVDASADYAEAQSVLEGPDQNEPSRLQRLSLGMRRLGRDFCKARVAKCDRCPLKPFLPPGGPIEPEGLGDESED